MTRFEQIAELLKEMPNATYEDMASELNITKGYAKTLISNMRKLGIIASKTVDGIREFEVFPEKIKPHNRKTAAWTRKDLAEQLLDIVFEALEEETQMENIINAGHLIIKLMDRL
ncbi:MULTISPECIES: hypothetical protein [unclassified Facklamia]|uniref:hypothetical protein n=1 Tax=Aerococcaceae TaxID=186827 RepID=UPI0013B826A0|nr:MULTISPECIES: hypothetical protein [unclassified Facklamia]MBS4462903.1 hypothetical protein [Aerococcaceae bacterium zg-B36]NEW65301.1 hypothetical protein [Facklamia sp. 252]NEW68799.1 hypothetical protein [Facklamia sp. 253]QQD66110.1 hypothetical protein JDW14_03105 [Aerococcaceae bacterium zg-252]